MIVETDFVENRLLAWEKLLSPGRQVVDGESIDLWVAVLQSARVTEVEFDAAALRILRTAKYFPKPSEVMEILGVIRAEARAALPPSRMQALEGRDMTPELREQILLKLPEEVQKLMRGQLDDDSLPGGRRNVQRSGFVRVGKVAETPSDLFTAEEWRRKALIEDARRARG